MPHLDLNLLLVFNTLMEERSVTRTGDRHARTQSAISNALGRLRASFDDQLFVRTADGLEPTPMALRLYELSTQVASLGDQCLALERGFDPARDSANFVLGAPDRLSLPVILPFIRHINAIAPNVRITLRTADKARGIELIRQKELGLFLGSATDIPNDLRRLHAFDEPLVCLCRKGHPIGTNRDLVDLETALRHPHLVVTSGGDHRSVFDEYLSDVGLERKTEVAVSNFTLTAELLSSSDMIGVFTRRIATYLASRNDLEILPLDASVPPVSHTLIWHRRMDDDRAHHWFRRNLALIYERDS